MKESDLYPPLKQFLQTQGYEVKGEVGDCDVLAVRNLETPLIVELKLTLNLEVILQAVDRLAMTPKVYVGIPRQAKMFERRRKHILKMLRMIGLGLILINSKSRINTVEVVLDPREYKLRKSKIRQERLLGEFAKRVGDPNLGGAEKRRGIITAYRQQAIGIAEFLREEGPTKAADIAKSLQEPKARNILYRNVYGWFERISQGIYQLSPRGNKEIILWEGKGR